jgi:tape measure domain-containing protein
MSNKLTTDIIINLAGNLSQKARQYSNQLGTLANKSQKSFALITTSAAAASKGIDTYGNRLLLGAGAASIAFERTFIKTAAEFERYQIMLNKLQGSEEAGAKAMAWIQQFTQDTPYGVNEVTSAFVRLKAFGLDPMDGTMQSIADQAAMMGGTAETIDGISLALGQAWTKGKLQGEEALQLLERGVPVWDYLVKASKDLKMNNGFGYTSEQLQKMASEGKLTREAIKALIKEMGSASEGAAKKQMETWSGMISNMGDHWTIFKKDVMQSGAFDVLKKELGGFLSQLDEMKKTGEYDEFVEKVGKNLVDAFEAAADAARGVKEVGEDLLPILKTLGSVTSGIADAVGGYDKLATILLSIYMVNKALRISAPLLQGVGKALNFGKAVKGGKGVSDAFASLGAMPVYVVNMPGGGFGGGDVPIDPKNPKKTPKGKWWTKFAITANSVVDLAAPYALRAARVAGPVGALTALASANEYDPTNPMFTPVDYSQGAKKQPLQTQQVKDAMDRFSQAYKRDSVWGTAGQTPIGGNVKLDINVSDDRIKVTPKYLPPGFTIDPDTGVN